MRSAAERWLARAGSALLWGCFLLALARVLEVAWRYREQPLLEGHAFRQTQTALTAWWLGRNGFSLAYETPVGGAPWALPFEFPIYQWLAVQWHLGTGMALDASGRLLSMTFLVGCLLPAVVLSRQLGMPVGSVRLFGVLLLSAPLHMFIGRCFLIETAALFFAFAAVPFVVGLVRAPRNSALALAAASLLALSGLQKSTTGFPVILALGLCWLWARRETVLRRPWSHRLEWMNGALAFGVPLALGLAWADYAAHLRSLNPLGASESSAALQAWIFGDWRMRYSPAVVSTIFWERMLQGNAAGGAGLLIIAAGVGLSRNRSALQVVIMGAALAVLPVLCFTNVHYLHDYYQCACLAFLLGAAAVASATLVAQSRWATCLLGVFAAAALGVNWHTFARTFAVDIERQFTSENNGTLAISRLLREETPADSAFVVFGYDWSSELAYYGERKCFAVPWFYAGYRDVWERPEQFLGGKKLGAFVVGITPEAPALDIEARLRALPGFRRHRVEWLDVMTRAD